MLLFIDDGNIESKTMFELVCLGSFRKGVTNRKAIKLTVSEDSIKIMVPCLAAISNQTMKNYLNTQIN